MPNQREANHARSHRIDMPRTKKTRPVACGAGLAAGIYPAFSP
jgi:hypothetical protein